MKKYRVGILGATGMVGQRFLSLLDSHPWFEVVVVAASSRSRGKTYQEAIEERWKIEGAPSEKIKNLIVKSVVDDMWEICGLVDFVFCALDLDKFAIQRIEESYASFSTPVVSNNSAHRWTEDIPMVMPEINPDHLRLIEVQRKKRGWNKGFIVVKPNCSIQSFTAVLTALKKFKPQKVSVVSLQSISGAGKTFNEWPEMIDNLIPNINGEEEKSEREPLKIWGELKGNKIVPCSNPYISATCIRIPVSAGHMSSVSVEFKNKPTEDDILSAVNEFSASLANLKLPSSPSRFIRYFSENDRPQIKYDREIEKGMGISMGKLRSDSQYGWKFISLAHNTIRGAAGGAVLLAELLAREGYLKKKN